MKNKLEPVRNLWEQPCCSPHLCVLPFCLILWLSLFLHPVTFSSSPPMPITLFHPPPRTVLSPSLIIHSLSLPAFPTPITLSALYPIIIHCFFLPPTPSLSFCLPAPAFFISFIQEGARETCRGDLSPPPTLRPEQLPASSATMARARAIPWALCLQPALQVLVGVCLELGDSSTKGLPITRSDVRPGKNVVIMMPSLTS